MFWPPHQCTQPFITFLGLVWGNLPCKKTKISAIRTHRAPSLLRTDSEIKFPSLSIVKMECPLIISIDPSHNIFLLFSSACKPLFGAFSLLLWDWHFRADENFGDNCPPPPFLWLWQLPSPSATLIKQTNKQTNNKKNPKKQKPNKQKNRSELFACAASLCLVLEAHHFCMSVLTIQTPWNANSTSKLLIPWNLLLAVFPWIYNALILKSPI